MDFLVPRTANFSMGGISVKRDGAGGAGDTFLGGIRINNRFGFLLLGRSERVVGREFNPVAGRRRGSRCLQGVTH